jgi:hypothetical protein
LTIDVAVPPNPLVVTDEIVTVALVMAIETTTTGFVVGVVILGLVALVFVLGVLLTNVPYATAAHDWTGRSNNRSSISNRFMVRS